MAGLGDTVASLVGRRWSGPVDHATGRMKDVPAFGDNPGGLKMLVHAPEGLAAKAALVLVLHGCTQTAEAYAAGAGWLSLADSCGFVLLCPEQSRANNPNLCFNWFQPSDVARGAGEAASIKAMIVHAIKHYDLDPRRVFITGLSAGGAMANAMLATYPETFAGGAIVAGLPYGAASNMQEALGAMRNARSLSAKTWGDAVRAASSHTGPWPSVSIWQGDDDTLVVPAVADELVRQWTDVHGLAGSAGESVGGPGRRRCTVWRKPSGEAAVELHRIAGMGHGAPLGASIEDGCGTAGAYLLEVGVSSSLEIVRSWGLDQPRPQASRNLRSEPQPAPTASAAPVALRPHRAPNVAGVITDALRTAGLLK